jgi:hypothetical protein
MSTDASNDTKTAPIDAANDDTAPPDLADLFALG